MLMMKTVRKKLEQFLGKVVFKNLNKNIVASSGM